MVKRILLTGATGFIGHHMVEHILKSTDWDIIALARLNFAGDLNRFKEMDVFKTAGNRVKFFFHDLNFNISEEKAKEIGKLDYILHLAANSHVDRSITHPKVVFSR